jgi:hypothetical protein
LPKELAELSRRATKLAEPERALLSDAGEDLEQLLDEIPDASLARDWAYLIGQMRADLSVPPERALEELEALRARLLRAGGARLFSISSSGVLGSLMSDIERLTRDLSEAPAAEAHELAATPLIRQRLAERERQEAPAFVGLVNPNTGSGVIINSAPMTTYQDLGEEALLRFLATKLYSGGGAHSLFIQTWGAGLAYSNGIGSNVRSGRSRYYAERCPELPQTLRFAIAQLRSARPDPFLAEYAIAQVFGDSRAAGSYETRGEAIAEDLVDGVSPDRVAAFRQAILDLRRTPDLAEKLVGRMEAVYGPLLPGYGPKPPVADSIYFVIGPERQLDLHEAYLRTVAGAEARLGRLHPRDFWIERPADSALSAQR